MTYYMLTIFKDNMLFANIYDNKDKFLKEHSFYSKKYPVRTFELKPARGEKFDVVITEANGKLVACLKPKEEIKDKKFVKCLRKEYRI